MAEPDIATLFARRDLHPDHDVSFERVRNAFSHTVGNAASRLSSLVALGNTAPVMLAIITNQEPNRIQLVHCPSKFVQPFEDPMAELNDPLLVTSGLNMTDLEIYALPSSLLTRQAAEVNDDAAATITAIVTNNEANGGAPAAGDPGSERVQVSRALVLPVEWTAAAVALSSTPITFKQFYQAFIEGLTPAQRGGDYSEWFNWWRAACHNVNGTTSSAVKLALPDLPVRARREASKFMRTKI